MLIGLLWERLVHKHSFWFLPEQIFYTAHSICQHLIASFCNSRQNKFTELEKVPNVWMLRSRIVVTAALLLLLLACGLTL